MLSILKSIKTANILLALLMSLLIFGAIIMPAAPAFQEINTTSLFRWLKDAPISVSWWLISAVGVLAILVLNTVVCSIDSIIKKHEGRKWLLTIAPQIIHTGFAFIMLAHLLSGIWSSHQFAVMREGQGVMVGQKTALYLDTINYKRDSGFITSMSAEILYLSEKGRKRRSVISPNHPYIHNGMGVYLKRISLTPFPQALIEFSYDPGAPWALAGGVIFLAGSVILTALKLRDKSV